MFNAASVFRGDNNRANNASGANDEAANASRNNSNNVVAEAAGGEAPAPRGKGSDKILRYLVNGNQQEQDNMGDTTFRPTEDMNVDPVMVDEIRNQIHRNRGNQ